MPESELSPIEQVKWHRMARIGLFEPGVSWVGWLCLVRLGLVEGLDLVRFGYFVTILWMSLLVWASRERTRPLVMAGALLIVLSDLVLIFVRALPMTQGLTYYVVVFEGTTLLLWAFVWGLWKR